MNLPLFEPTLSVSELCSEIRDFLAEGFSSQWVAGEVERLRESRRGHLYFELVEKGDDDQIAGKIDAVIWRTDHQRVRRQLAETDQRLGEGLQIRCRGGVDFWPPGGRLQLVVREVDPVFTLGLLARRRRETLAALTAAGLLDVNRALELPPVPLRVALITSEGSAAYHDFLTTLEESGYGFQVLLLHASVQGREAEREVASAFAALGGAAVDCAVLIRGGGAKTDLAAFDSRAVAEAIARSPVPVITGLGHQVDESIADRVAHTAVKTPTKAAELLIERVERVELALAELEVACGRAAMDRLVHGREAVGRAERGVALARLRLAAAGERLAEQARALSSVARGRLGQERRRHRDLAGHLSRIAPARLRRAVREPRLLAERLATASRLRLRRVAEVLGALDRLAQQLSPQRILARGFSLTRDGDGTLVRDAGQVSAGDLLVTRLAAGTVNSRVEKP